MGAYFNYGGANDLISCVNAYKYKPILNMLNLDTLQFCCRIKSCLLFSYKLLLMG